MRKNVFGRKLKRDKNERKALFKSLMSSLVMHERIKTTKAKAKAIRPEIEKLITKAKQQENSAKKILEKSLSREAFDKILKDIAPRFAKKAGGYTRILNLGNRFGDDASFVIMEWTEAKSQNIEPEGKQEEKETKSERKNPSSRKDSKGRKA